MEGIIANLNIIDDDDEKKLYEFKCKLQTPIDYKTHFDKYKFNKLWFDELDLILVNLGYKCDDIHIKDVIKLLTEKLLETPLGLIYYHLERNNIQPDLPNIYNANVFNIIADSTLYSFSMDENTETVRFIIQNKDKIIWDVFVQNQNNLAVRYCLDNLDKWDDSSKILFSNNSNPLAVDYCIEHPNIINWMEFSRNQNTRAVEFCIKNKNNICWPAMAMNENNLAVEFCIKNKKFIDWEDFSRNENDTAVNFCIKNKNSINWKEFSQNSNIIAVKFCLDNLDKIDWESFSLNTNDLAVDYLIKNNKYFKPAFVKNTNTKALIFCTKNKLYNTASLTYDGVDRCIDPDSFKELYIKIGLIIPYSYKKQRLQAIDKLKWLPRSGIKLCSHYC